MAVHVGEGVTHNPVLNYPTLARCVDKLALGRHESLHVAANGLSIYLTTPLSKRRVVSAMRRTGSLIKQLPEAVEPSDDFAARPQRFSELIPLMRTWSISDDSDRGNKLARASTERLTRLVNAVTPHFKAINRHLDEFRHRAVPEPAAMLGTLAECACEAQLLLATRRR